jgi:regulator of cell morphogenesis and NO signaling
MTITGPSGITISETTTVGEIASKLPAAVGLLQHYQIDFCCGGKPPLGDVCRQRGLSFAAFAAELQAAAAPRESEQRNWTSEPLRTLIAHIVTVYHDTLRAEMPRLEQLAAAATRAHGQRFPFLARLEDAIGELSADLNGHMRKEESILFPAIERLELGDRQRAWWLSQPIRAMEEEHDRAGELLAELRMLTSEYVSPEWACATVRALYGGLEGLESSMQVHVHLENNVLFPRALRLAGRAAVTVAS